MAAKGDFIKAIGADWGAYWDGMRWVRFECVGCAFALGVLTGHRLQNADHTRVHIGPGTANSIRHDRDLHNAWIQAGKPVRGPPKES